MKFGWMGRAGLVSGLALVLLGTVIASGEDACDMKTVEKAFYCEKCEVVHTKKELVSKKKYYTCEPCSRVSAKPGKCEGCEKKLTKVVSGREVCPKCYAAPLHAQACVKTAYACPKCGALSAKPAKCQACKASHRKTTVRAVILFRCTGCTKTSVMSGRCKDAKCKQNGKPLVMTCSQSGKVPHTAPAKDKDGKKSSGSKGKGERKKKE